MNTTQLTALLEAQQKVIEKIALGTDLAESLTAICEQIECVIGSSQAKSSILLLKGNQLRHGAAPRLPKVYCDAIDGVVIGPSVGSCGTASFTGKQVIVSDIEHDPLWSNFKSFALEHDLRACWSTPILSSRKEILGSFAIYYSEVKQPDKFHLDLISRFTHFSSIAIEKMQNEAVLRDSENYRRTLFEASPIGHVLNRLDGTLVDVNSSYAKITGHSVEELLNLSYWDITPEKYQEKEIQKAQSLESTGSYGPYEKEYIHKDGHLVPIRLSGKYLEIKGEQFVWSSVEDISQQKKTEIALRRTQKMDAIGQLTGGIAHDFNNIMGIIKGNLHFLRKELINHKKEMKRVNAIEKASQRAIDLTRQLLSFSRKHESKRLPTNINQKIQYMNSLIARTVTPEVEVAHEYSDELWLTDIDPGDFEDALLNLVLNARDVMPSGGKLSIKTCNCHLEKNSYIGRSEITAGEYVQLIVSDTGDGMSKDVQEHIFEPFFTTKSEKKGTGLGLAMVFGFINRSMGHIEVYSEIGIGSIFRLYLPKSKSMNSPQTKTEQNSLVLPKGEEMILVVDDEEGLLEIARESLQTLGYKVLTANNGLQALQRLAKNPEISLLFSDVVMPGGINGYELAEKATELRPELKILLTSGFTERAMSQNEQARFESNLLSKPYTQLDLALQVRAQLGK